MKQHFGLLIVLTLSSIVGGVHATQLLGYGPLSSSSQLPSELLIKTQDMGQNTNFQYALAAGKLYYRLRPEMAGSPVRTWTKSGKMKVREDSHPNEIEIPPTDQWTLFQGHGFPHRQGQALHQGELTTVWADGDEVGVFDQIDHAFWLRERTDKKQWPMGEWNSEYGTPKKFQLILPPQLKNPRAVALGRRTEDVKFFEDAMGFEHHWGTFNISTLYVLSPDGRQIYYLDPGLPLDYRYQICLPQRARQELIALDVSSSTMMVMDKSGKIHTKLEDFDTNGADSMLFAYSYLPHPKGQLPGTEPLSRWSTYHLASHDDWQEHPWELTANARISRFITIITTGQGNQARELRVAGLGAEGESGYYKKSINDKNWEFIAADLEINPEELFIPRELRPEEMLPPKDQDFQGTFIVGDENFEVQVEGLNDQCMDSRLRIGRGGQWVEYRLFQDPTFTRQDIPTFSVPEVPMVSFGTLIRNIPFSEISGQADVEKFRYLIEEFFRPIEGETFSLELVKFQGRLLLQPRDKNKNKRWRIELQQTRPTLSLATWENSQIQALHQVRQKMKKDIRMAKFSKLGLRLFNFHHKFRLMQEMIPANIFWSARAYDWALEQLPLIEQ